MPVRRLEQMHLVGLGNALERLCYGFYLRVKVISQVDGSNSIFFVLIFFLLSKGVAQLRIEHLEDIGARNVALHDLDDHGNKGGALRLIEVAVDDFINDMGVAIAHRELIDLFGKRLHLGRHIVVIPRRRRRRLLGLLGLIVAR